MMSQRKAMKSQIVSNFYYFSTTVFMLGLTYTTDLNVSLPLIISSYFLPSAVASVCYIKVISVLLSLLICCAETSRRVRLRVPDVGCHDNVGCGPVRCHSNGGVCGVGTSSSLTSSSSTA